jgi:arginine/lysine/histidine transporter system substrate-binding protein
VDLGNEIGKDLGTDVRWIKVSGYNHLFEVLEKGEAEILISTIAVDPKRTDKFAFSNTYYDSGDAITRRRETAGIKDLASLAGKKVGVATGRPGDLFLSNLKTPGNVSVSRFKTLDDAMGALNRTEIDAVFGDQPILLYSSFQSFKNLTVLQAIVNNYRYAVVVRKRETELLQKINATLDRLKTSGELEAMKAKWFRDVREKAAEEQGSFEKNAALIKSPKSISVNITKLSGAFNMDRLDGFVLVLQGSSGAYQSEPILTNGNKGHCKFTKPVPPGEYKLNMSIFKMTTTVTVPELAKSALTMDMNIAASGINITLK